MSERFEKCHIEEPYNIIKCISLLSQVNLPSKFTAVVGFRVLAVFAFVQSPFLEQMFREWTEFP